MNRSIQYVDLETDICVRLDGRILKVDREKLEEMIVEGYVSEKLGEITDEKMGEILNSLSLDTEKISS